MENARKELTLLLLFLAGWEEDSRKNPGEKIFRAWKGYLFEDLNLLADEKMIVQYANTKSVTLTPEGIKKATEIKNKIKKALDSSEEAF